MYYYKLASIGSNGSAISAGAPKPKATTDAQAANTSEFGKEAQGRYSGPKERGSAKKSRTGTVTERAAPSAYIVLSSPEPEDDIDTPAPRESLAVRSGPADITPLPERGIVYRY
ncbi:uncharacterized protein J4E79_002356 [Alternaria viburni]|uniref:uncharacterized protein n=1 Tax=Alternaria viburni TaxID=566460 RepID=UPI0020C46321|nr:uncharacterized protein J4E79_002356 [Alternaria viburni]KAI4666319.1 hypothetical protein J4E79_002356 [Alternaria viburni]